MIGRRWRRERNYNRMFWNWVRQNYFCGSTGLNLKITIISLITGKTPPNILIKCAMPENKDISSTHLKFGISHRNIWKPMKNWRNRNGINTCNIKKKGHLSGAWQECLPRLKRWKHLSRSWGHPPGKAWVWAMHYTSRRWGISSSGRDMTAW